ncbi:MAG: Xcc1710-like domain-containing protein [Methylotenera sp.]|nr:Xcc1710-like domain-containing protein [Methylotenera sp.]
MKLHLTQSEGNHLITAYSGNSISINHQAYLHSLIVMPQTLITDWHTSSYEQLNLADFEKAATLKPELVLLGTGQAHHFLHPKIYAPLTQQGISLECMSTVAACRTYNILMSEGRNVLAMLIAQ